MLWTSAKRDVFNSLLIIGQFILKSFVLYHLLCKPPYSRLQIVEGLVKHISDLHSMNSASNSSYDNIGVQPDYKQINRLALNYIVWKRSKLCFFGNERTCTGKPKETL